MENWINRVFCEDNLIILKQLPANSIDLIYIDPPFFTQTEFEDFTDIWKNITKYIEFMKVRIQEMYRILKSTGTFYLHCDFHADGYLRVLCDSIFKRDPQNVIIWKRYGGVKNNASKKYSCQTDTILFYTKSDNFTFKIQYRELTKDQIKHEYKYRDKNGRRYALLRGGVYQNTGISKKKYLDECKGSPITSLWDDENLILNTSSSEDTGYSTQKPEALLKRIIKASSNEGDIILDTFCGSGTTLVVAKQFNRKYIGIDQNPKAIDITNNRLKSVIQYKTFTNLLKKEE